MSVPEPGLPLRCHVGGQGVDRKSGGNPCAAASIIGAMDRTDYLKFAAALRKRLAEITDPDPSLAARIEAVDAWGGLMADGADDAAALANTDELMGRAGTAITEREIARRWEAAEVFYGRWRHGAARVGETDVRRIEEIVRSAFGRPAWDVSLGWGSFITMSFGEPRADELLHGDWYLWVAMAAWRLESDTEVVVASEFPRPYIGRAIKILEGRSLDGVTVRPPSLETTLRFGHLRLHLFPMYAETQRALGDWMLWTPGDLVLTVGEGAVWRYEPGSTPRSAGLTGAGPEPLDKSTVQRFGR